MFKTFIDKKSFFIRKKKDVYNLIIIDRNPLHSRDGKVN